MDPTTLKELEHLRTSLGEWALGDVQKAAAGGAKVGSFILAGALIEALAGLAYSRPGENSKAAWDEFVPVFLPRYDGHAEALYRGYRGALSHWYSVNGFRLVDGTPNKLRHWRIEAGERVLHLESFVEDLEQAWSEFSRRLDDDETFRDRVLNRTRKRPTLGILGGEPVEAAFEVAEGFSLVLSGNQPTHFGMPAAVRAASGSSPPSVPKGPMPNRAARRRRA